MKFWAKALAVLMFPVIVASTPAFAFETGGPKIKGNAKLTTTAGNMVNLAAGFKTKAELSVASMHKGEVGGDLTLTVAAKNIVNLAAGFKTKACTSLASIGSPSC